MALHYVLPLDPLIMRDLGRVGVGEVPAEEDGGVDEWVVQLGH